jgi:CRISPR-associated RAMP protein (TIGR02581 family)
MFDRFSNRLTVEGWLVTETALRVGTGRATEPVGTDLPVMRDELGRPFIPGSSFKGTLRARAESFIRAVVPGNRFGACLPTSEDERCILRGRHRADPKKQYVDSDPIGIGDLQVRAVEKEQQARQTAIKSNSSNYKRADAFLAEEIWNQSCMACRTFGSPWLASHVQVRDLAVDPSRWFGQFQIRDGVAIDRDTETVAGAQLYNYEVVPSDTRFDCRVVIENVETWQLGLLWLALQPFIQEEMSMSLGGFRSRGMGWVKFAKGDPRLYYFSLNGSNADAVDRLMDYLKGETPGGEPVAPEQIEAWKWVEAFRDELKKARQRAGV